MGNVKLEYIKPKEDSTYFGKLGCGEFFTEVGEYEGNNVFMKIEPCMKGDLRVNAVCLVGCGVLERFSTMTKVHWVDAQIICTRQRRYDHSGDWGPPAIG